jgi:hypothetical protein
LALNLWKNSSPMTKRIIGAAIFFVISIAATVAGALTPLSAEDANAINQELEHVRENASVQYIFGNNLMICMAMFVPIVGPIFGVWVLYNTGVVISAQSMSASAQGMPALLILLYLFIFPFTWLEFLSYSAALAESVWLFRRIFRRIGRREIRNAATLISIVAVMLLTAAIIETVLILSFGA